MCGQMYSAVCSCMENGNTNFIRTKPKMYHKLYIRLLLFVCGTQCHQKLNLCKSGFRHVLALTPSINFDKCREEIALNEFGNPWCKRDGVEVGALKALKRKVQVGKDQEKAQSEKDSHSKNRGGKKPN